MSTTIKGFWLDYKDEENGVLHFQHSVGGQSFSVEATREEMRHYHLHRYYELRFCLGDMHPQSGRKAA